MHEGTAVEAMPTSRHRAETVAEEKGDECSSRPMAMAKKGCRGGTGGGMGGYMQDRRSIVLGTSGTSAR